MMMETVSREGKTLAKFGKKTETKQHEMKRAGRKGTAHLTPPGHGVTGDGTNDASLFFF